MLRRPRLAGRGARPVGEARVRAAGIDRPDTLTFVPIDFETQALAAEWASAGFARTEIAAQLRSLGFTGVEDRSAAELIAGYLAATTENGSSEFEGEPPQALRASR